jgi:hypothetical protein
MGSRSEWGGAGVHNGYSGEGGCAAQMSAPVPMYYAQGLRCCAHTQGARPGPSEVHPSAPQIGQ